MRRTVAIAAVVAATWCAAPGAAADSTVVASIQANVPISAQGGWVVWSARREDGWVLMAWRDGVTTTLPAAPRQQPFDLDLGSDARGHTMITFSRCARAPRMTFDGHPAAWTGSGCRLRVLDLAGGRERGAGVPRRAGSSDTTPSMWNGRIAFARRARRQRHVTQVMLWSPREHRLTRLRRGGFRANCPIPGGCRAVPIRGAVESLDLGARLAAFLWWVQGPWVIGHGGWEVRADDLATGRGVLAGAGFLGEACTEGTDRRTPSAPFVDATKVWFSVLSSVCYRNKASLVRFDARRGRGMSGALAGEILQFAKDGDTLYGLVAPTPRGEVAPQCDLPGAPCAIKRLDRPARMRAVRPPHPPFI